jgi:predicted RNase H-like nuclease (RuvC/YqgF family)
MKKYLILLLIPVLFACGRAAKKEAESLKTKNDSLMAQTMQKDESINEFIATVNDIQESLDTIKMKENIINLNTNKNGELKLSAKDQIKTDITSIYLLMQKNKKELNDLNRKLRSSNMKVTELQKLVDRLQKDVNDRNVEIEALRDKLAKLNIVIEEANLRLDTLTKVVKIQSSKLSEQQKTLAQQEADLNTAYYIIGTEKDLKTAGIIGKNDNLLTDFNKVLFTKVDIRKLTEVSILSKKAKVISNHPLSSYKLVGDKKIVQSLQITDYKAFWSNVRYLVIMVY